ncbi:aryl-alcohol dehydrogenase-like predicted oxidoreductase [Cryobacterium sp. CAN_C3]|nr:aryl-alcohol dehydrogenase-like predicted oxidoreductase [Cryobacterium sp. CAN_C3]
MSHGEPERGNHAWTLNEEISRPFIRRALEAGINFFDTANIYSAGSSAEILGRALREYAHRDEVVVATKVHGSVGDGPNQSGLSRKAVLQEIDNSLRRLDLDYVDLYIVHRFDPFVEPARGARSRAESSLATGMRRPLAQRRTCLDRPCTRRRRAASSV